MPNAKDVTGPVAHKFLIAAPTGHGKTSQFLTLPGKKFAYLFDPNALLSLRGYDVEFEQFLPDRINLSVAPLAKDAKRDKTTSYQSTLYNEWEKDFDDKMQGKFFEQFDWLMLDSSTTLLDMIMDRILTLNGRYGQWPHQDDWGPQMMAFKNIIRQWTSLGKGIYVTAHLNVRQDELTKKVWEDPMFTGALRQQLPLLFSDIFTVVVEPDKDNKPQYLLKTFNDRNQRFIRTSIRGLEPYENVTLDFDKPLEGQGLGGIVNWWARQQQAA